ncbi:MAG: pyridoxamine 5'-phosphate oxidase family protein [Chloroflexota bacterium]
MSSPENTLRILEFLRQNPEGITPNNILAQVEISRSSLFSLLKELKSLGYLEQIRERGRYTAGPRLIAWQHSSPKRPQDILTAFYQEAANAPLDETLALVNREQQHIFVLAQVESSQQVRSTFDLGRQRSDKNAALAVITSTPQKNIKQQGFHLQTYTETIELAIPICSDGVHPEAALMVTAPRFRHSEQSILSHLDALREMAAHISYRLGAHIYAPYQTEESHTPGPTIPLSDDEISTFLSGPWTARLACIRPDNTPHVVPVWHEWNEGVFYIAAWEGSNWASYVRANPKVSLSVDEPWSPLRRVSAQGQALPANQVPGGINALLDRLSQRYLGHPHYSKQPWQAFSVKPDRVKGWRGLNN